MDRVELPLEVWVLRGSVEGGPVGPRKESNGGRKVNPSLTDKRASKQLSPCPHVNMWYDTETRAKCWILSIP